jgi:glycosyltransferase involved in cell wall biosynthesis
MSDASMPPLRILLCVHQFFPEFGAGTEVLTLSTAKALQGHGYTLGIVTGLLTETAPPPTEFEGIPVYRLATPHYPGRFNVDTALHEYDNPSIAPAFAAVVEAFKPDLVHFFHLKNLTLACLRECFRRSIPTVYTPTDYWIACRTCQLLKPWGKSECTGPDTKAANCLKHVASHVGNPALSSLVKRTPTPLFTLLAAGLEWLSLPRLARLRHLSADLRQRKGRIAQHLSRVDLLLPPTRSLQDALLDTGMPAERIQLLRYAVQPPVIKYQRVPCSVDNPRVVIGFIGTLVEHKGCHVLLEALGQITSLTIELRIYGDTQHYPTYTSTLKALAGDDPRVHFRGTFAPDDIGTVLSQLDVLVIPSTWRENAPLVLLNALASGTQVIASDVSGITEYLSDDDNVQLFEKGNYHALADLLKTRLSSGKTQARSEGRIAGSSLQTYVSSLHDAYTRLIKRSHGQRDKL